VKQKIYEKGFLEPNCHGFPKLYPVVSTIGAAPPLFTTLLPSEIRLMTAEYVFEQPQNAVFAAVLSEWIETYPDVSHATQCMKSYSAASNLHPLLVCGQFYREFQSVAYNKTWFVLRNTSSVLPHELAQNVRKIALQSDNHCQPQTPPRSCKLPSAPVSCQEPTPG
jgi:hypothetical protein